MKCVKYVVYTRVDNDMNCEKSIKGAGEMNKKLIVGFITTYSGRWPEALPTQRNQEYGDWLVEELPELDIVRASALGSTKEAIEQITKEFKASEVDIIVMVYGAFTGDDVASWLSEMVRVPLLLWAPYEVPFEKDDRLYANALCSMTMNAAAIRRVGAVYHTVYGNKEDARAAAKVKRILRAYNAVKGLRYTNLGLLGYRPTAFYNCAFDESLIRKTFGVKIEETDLKIIFDKMDALPEEAVVADIERVNKEFNDIQLPEGHIENHSKLFLAMQDVIKEQGYDFCTIKCWPEMGSLHTTPCAVLGRLADEGFHVGCEGDVDAELAQMTQNYLTGCPTFITDLINVHEDNNEIVFWHCGNAAPSLFNKEVGMQLRNHPLAGQGSAIYGALKPGVVTIARFCNMNGTYKLYLLKGEAVPADRYTKGVMVTVKVEKPVRDILDQIIEEGVPHHYSIVWDDVVDDMKEVAKLLNIPVIEA